MLLALERSALKRSLPMVSSIFQSISCFASKHHKDGKCKYRLRPRTAVQSRFIPLPSNRITYKCHPLTGKVQSRILTAAIPGRTTVQIARTRAGLNHNMLKKSARRRARLKKKRLVAKCDLKFIRKSLLI